MAALAFRLQGAAACGVAAAALAVVSIQMLGPGLAQIGLAGPPDFEKIGPLVLGGLAASYAVAGVISLVLSRVGLAPDVTRLDFLKGNLPALILMLSVSWTTAAFGEEIVFRGFLLNRMASLETGVEHWAWIALIVQASVFGLAHAYQGLGGVIVTAALGAVLGVLTLVANGDLWPAIIVHGLINTASLTAIYISRPVSTR
jgi:hypothetical protein